MIFILGTKGTIGNVDSFVKELLTFSGREHLIIQAFDANMIYHKDHLVSAVHHAKRAFQQKTNATNSLALEILLYTAGERQIQKAIKKVGVKKGKQSIVFLITAPLEMKRPKSIDSLVVQRLLQTFRLTRDDTVPRKDTSTLKRFGITKKELSTVPKEKYGDLILEKVALVDLIKK